MTSKLHSTELCIYFSTWIAANCYCLYNLFQVQNALLGIAHETKWSGLEPGWDLLSRHRDVSDNEWKMWKYFFQTSWYYLTFQFFTSEMIRYINKSYLNYWYIISSVIFVLKYMGVKQLLVIMVQPVLFLMVMFSGGGKVSLWLLSIGVIESYNTLKYKHYIWYFFQDYKYPEDLYLVSGCLSWTQLRCISFCIDYMDRKANRNTSKDMAVNGTSIWETIINMLSYIFYLPLLYIGPLILYEDFERSFQVKSDDITKRLQTFIKDMALFLLYTFILDLAFHYIYFIAMQNGEQFIKELPTVALCGAGLWLGLEFHIKYVISYGTTAAFARLDNMEAPPTPRCIARVHAYSQMWRYFDVGLYKFLTKYIYKPSLSAISTYLKAYPIVLQKLTASLAAFIFIFIWHGAAWDIFIWTSLNFLFITLENLGKATSTTESYKWFKKEVLRSDEMEVRLQALICTPLAILSAITNLSLISGRDALSNEYFARIFNPTMWNFTIVTFCVYCCCHVSIALQHVSSRTDVKRNKLHIR